MRRFIVPLAIGGAVGAALMWLAGGGDGSAGTAAGVPRSVLETVVRLTGGGDTPSADRLSVAEQLEAYRSVAGESDLDRLLQAIEAASSRPSSLERDLAIDAALGRIAALAPEFAVETVLALGLERRFVVEAYVLLAEVDADAALAELGRIADTGMRREAALALVESFGDGALARDRVAAVLPPADRDPLIVALLERRAEYDPVGALREAQGLGDDTLRAQVVGDMARTWARQDPAAAIGQADLLPENLVMSFRAAVHAEWARIDAEGYASYLESMGRRTDDAAMATGLQVLVAIDPERALRIAGNLPGPIGESMQANAWREIALRDPAALTRIGSLPAGQLRDRIAMTVASGLAGRDPDAALAWAESLSPPVPNALRTVVMAIAQNDPLRALDLMDRPSLASDASLILTIATNEIGRNPARARELAELLAARDDPPSASALQGVVAGWMQQDPEAALSWVLARDANIDGNVLSSAAQTMARNDPAAAAAFAGRLPDRYRAAWVTQVAGQYAGADAEAALAWVGQFRGQPYYTVAMRDVLVNAARMNPRAAAAAMIRADADVQLGAAQQIATAWAQTEPRAAADWALELGNARARESALTGAVGAWAQRDFAAARSWTLRLPPGPARDRAITGIIGRSVLGAVELDWDLVAAIDDDLIRQQSASYGIGLLARTDPRRAEALLDSEITDPAVREQTRQLIERAREMGPAGGAANVFILDR